MSRRILLSFVVCLLLLSTLPAAAPQGAPPSPEEFLGFQVGADRKLADYEQIAAYFQALDRASDRVALEAIGTSTQGRTIWMAAISTPENLAGSTRHQEIARRLADPRGLSPTEMEALVGEGKAIVLVTCAIHSTEIGASQMAMELAYALATTSDPAWERILGDVILLLAPSINPDGTTMVVDWYRKGLGTPQEGGQMPWLYHPYAGHDNNRDFFMLELPETRAVNTVLTRTWLPQVYLDEHQMGSTGPRIFVPPFTDPIAANVHPLVWRLVDLFGTEMAVQLQQAGKQGVIDSYAFDGYWPGGTMNTAWWKNIVGLLTEVASAQIATPVRIEENELAGNSKGLPDYRSQVSFPDPWPGGSWTLRDIVDYELIATRSLLETASLHRSDLLRDRARMALDAVARGRTGSPRAFAFPPAPRDAATAAHLVEILLAHGIEIGRAEAPFASGRRQFPAGTLVVPLDQPNGPFARELLEVQRYPEIVAAPGGEILRPYDVTGWTLPLQMGVEGEWIDAAPDRLPLLTVPPDPGGGITGEGDVWLLGRESNAAALAVNRLLAEEVRVRTALASFRAGGRAWAAGTYLVTGAKRDKVESIAIAAKVTLHALPAEPEVRTVRLQPARVGLYKPWAASMDEGWTRLVLERFGFPYQSLDNAAMRGGGLRKRFDVLVLPDLRMDVMIDGFRKPEEGESSYRTELPPEYRGGIGEEGVKALTEFVDAGGTLVTLDTAAELPIAKLNLPVRDVLTKVPASDFLCPGALLAIDVDSNHPLGFGVPGRIAGYFAASPAFATSIPGAEADRAVVARYPDEPLLLSGWIRGDEKLRRRAAIVDVRRGKGRVVLLGFRVQHRAQTHGTFRLLFNALERAGWEDGWQKE